MNQCITQPIKYNCAPAMTEISMYINFFSSKPPPSSYWVAKDSKCSPYGQHAKTNQSERKRSPFPENSQKYRVSKKYWSGSPEKKTAFKVGPSSARRSPALCGSWIVSPLINLKSAVKVEPPPLTKLLDPCMPRLGACLA